MKKFIASAALTLLTAGSVATSIAAPARAVTANFDGAEHLTAPLTTVPTDSELELDFSENPQEQQVASGYICDYYIYPDGSYIYDCLVW